MRLLVGGAVFSITANESLYAIKIHAIINTNKMEDNKTSEEQPMTIREALQFSANHTNTLAESFNAYKDSHTAHMQSEIDRLNKEVERLKKRMQRF